VSDSLQLQVIIEDEKQKEWINLYPLSLIASHTYMYVGAIQQGKIN